RTLTATEFSWISRASFFRRDATRTSPTRRRQLFWPPSAITGVPSGARIGKPFDPHSRRPVVSRPYITPTNPWFSEKWSPERMQAINDSAKWGIPVDMLEMLNEFDGPRHLGRIALWADKPATAEVRDNEL